jgi:hypothetical protein
MNRNKQELIILICINSVVSLLFFLVFKWTGNENWLLGTIIFFVLDILGILNLYLPQIINRVNK